MIQFMLLRRFFVYKLPFKKIIKILSAPWKLFFSFCLYRRGHVGNIFNLGISESPLMDVVCRQHFACNFKPLSNGATNFLQILLSKSKKSSKTSPQQVLAFVDLELLATQLPVCFPEDRHKIARLNISNMA
jgi:hypothetical protein